MYLFGGTTSKRGDPFRGIRPARRYPLACPGNVRSTCFLFLQGFARITRAGNLMNHSAIGELFSMAPHLFKFIPDLLFFWWTPVTMITGVVRISGRGAVAHIKCPGRIPGPFGSDGKPEMCFIGIRGRIFKSPDRCPPLISNISDDPAARQVFNWHTGF